jgi:hypothetical protein
MFKIKQIVVELSQTKKALTDFESFLEVFLEKDRGTDGPRVLLLQQVNTCFSLN